MNDLERADDAEAVAAADAAIDVDALPVRLVFVAGRTEIPLRELQRLSPGQVLDLHGPVGGHVEVRANGRRIGSGELVEIDGRVGVRMLRCDLLEAG